MQKPRECIDTFLSLARVPRRGFEAVAFSPALLLTVAVALVKVTGMVFGTGDSG